MTYSIVDRRKHHANELNQVKSARCRRLTLLTTPVHARAATTTAATATTTLKMRR
jgi:hypothetical protein